MANDGIKSGIIGIHWVGFYARIMPSNTLELHSFVYAPLDIYAYPLIISLRPNTSKVLRILSDHIGE